VAVDSHGCQVVHSPGHNGVDLGVGSPDRGNPKVPLSALAGGFGARPEQSMATVKGPSGIPVVQDGHPQEASVPAAKGLDPNSEGDRSVGEVGS
jgi:hypothetical protein